MKPRSHTAVAPLIAGLIALAVLASFFAPLFFGRTPSVVLPEEAEPTESGAPSGAELPGGDYVRVEVTPETVQNVIATLTRPQSYYRELTAETLWDGGQSSGAASVQVWADGGFVRTDAILPGGAVRHSIVGGERAYLWYDGDEGWFETAADELSADLAQGVPTYETVLALEVDDIADAGYVTLDGMSCIYVETRDDGLGYLERYWVGVSSGLLVAAETVKGEAAVYRMTSGLIEYPVPEDASFVLPDGTALHTLSQT